MGYKENPKDKLGYQISELDCFISNLPDFSREDIEKYLKQFNGNLDRIYNNL